MFIIGDGAAGAIGELERRKFTAEEGVSSHSLTPRSQSDRSDLSGPFDTSECILSIRRHRPTFLPLVLFPSSQLQSPLSSRLNPCTTPQVHGSIRNKGGRM